MKGANLIEEKELVSQTGEVYIWGRNGRLPRADYLT